MRNRSFTSEDLANFALEAMGSNPRRQPSGDDCAAACAHIAVSALEELGDTGGLPLSPEDIRLLFAAILNVANRTPSLAG